ncbi:uncharacterized protein LOC100768212 [Cricetulus griseus]|uniref:Uncharacterized protein LOC100768212 n=1 Tax=Cricetulus griseus TaxID=10029 RepID=A0A9J7HD56_CRIGR|nr:uncharacterized protein LOC100768212 [Cricetulus griseus]XP_035309837.1 uncharacterized protein LOC100768212 [Cricetulus griseus]
MAEDPNSQMNSNKRPTKSGRMDEQQNAIYPSEVQPHIMPRQEISQVPVVLQWPTAFIPINCTPVTLSPQMMIALSWDPCQPVTIPCLVSNVVLQPCINTIPPVLPAQVLVSSNICLQGRGNANLAPGNSTQISDASNQGREICTQLPDASNQGREICTQINDASNQGPEVYTQIPAISNQRAVSAEVDRQKVLDAAEALLILHNSPQAWEETRSIPGPDGE